MCPYENNIPDFQWKTNQKTCCLYEHSHTKYIWNYCSYRRVVPTFVPTYFPHPPLARPSALIWNNTELARLKDPGPRRHLNPPNTLQLQPGLTANLRLKADVKVNSSHPSPWFDKTIFAFNLLIEFNAGLLKTNWKNVNHIQMRSNSDFLSLLVPQWPYPIFRVILSSLVKWSAP